MGPAGLMTGTTLLQAGFEVHFFDHKKAAGRKFLVAGHGGFNLTHSEDKEVFKAKYNHPFLKDAFLKFDNDEWRKWLQSIQIETYVGSSGKIFPIKGIKPIEVLTNWLTTIEKLGGFIHYSHKLIDFSEKEVVLEYDKKEVTYSFDHLVFAMGGASWKKTGSTGDWLDLFLLKQIECVPFESSNSGFEVENTDKLASLEGQTLKNTDTSFGLISRKGDVVISSYGLEGAPIYYVNKVFRENREGHLSIDLKPTKTQEEIVKVLQKSKNITEGLKALHLSKTAIQLIKILTTKEEFSDTETLAKRIKKLQFKPTSLRPIDEVISTIGGISMNSVTSEFQLKQYSNIYACGEMLDWDAPTGGYLIQGCVSTGYVVAKTIIELHSPSFNHAL